MNLGLPYKGSKNTIANDIVKALPRGKKLLDACCGGGAILMAAAMSGRWEKVVGNDLNAATIALLDAVLIHKGQIEYEHPPVCTRDDFFHSLQRIENGDFTIQDCVNKYCASFGNNGQSYLWNPEIEKIKVNVEQMLVATRLPERRRAFRKFISYLEEQAEFDLAKLENIQQLQNLERLQRLERLEQLERLERLERLDIFDIDYSEFDVVYFDIPYKGTAEYDFDFDYDRFYRLFETLGKPAFLSEYNSSYTCVMAFNKRALLCKASRKNGKKEKLEKLYFNGTIDDYKRLMGAEYRPLDEGKQIDIFEGVA
jgi:site-specific DNA-adenine methylase